MAFRLTRRRQTVRLTVPVCPESGFRERGELSDRLCFRGAVGSCHDHGRDHAERSVEGACGGQAGSLADPARFMARRRAFQIPVASYGSCRPRRNNRRISQEHFVPTAGIFLSRVYPTE
jgi:hypothetical protein